MHFIHRDVDAGLKPPKRCRDGKNAQFWAYLQTLPTLYAPEKSQKQLNYMLIPAKCIRETFECIGCIGPQKGPKIGKKVSKEKNAQFRALYEPLQARY